MRANVLIDSFKYTPLSATKGTFSLDADGKPVIVIGVPELESQNPIILRSVVAHEGAHFRRWLLKKREFMAQGKREKEAAKLAWDATTSEPYGEERAAVASEIRELRKNGLGLRDPELVKKLNSPME